MLNFGHNSSFLPHANRLLDVFPVFLGQWFSSWAAHWDYLGTLKNAAAWSHPGGSGLTDLRHSLGIKIVKLSPGEP